MNSVLEVVSGNKNPTVLLQEFQNALLSGSFVADEDSFRSVHQLLKAGITQNESLISCGLTILNELLRLPHADLNISPLLENIFSVLDSIVQRYPNALAIDVCGILSSMILSASGFSDFNGRAGRLLAAAVTVGESSSNLDEHLSIITAIGRCVQCGGGTVRSHEAKISAYLIKQSLHPSAHVCKIQGKISKAARVILSRLCWVSHVGAIASLSHENSNQQNKQTLATSIFEKTFTDARNLVELCINFDIGVINGLASLSLDSSFLPPVPPPGSLERILSLSELLVTLLQVAPLSPTANQGAGGVYLRTFAHGGDAIIVTPIVAALELFEKLLMHLRRRVSEVVTAVSVPYPPPILSRPAGDPLPLFSHTSWDAVLVGVSRLVSTTVKVAGVGGALIASSYVAKVAHAFVSPLDAPGASTTFAFLTMSAAFEFFSSLAACTPALLHSRLPIRNTGLRTGSANSSPRVSVALVSWIARTVRTTIGSPAETYRLVSSSQQCAMKSLTDFYHAAELLRSAVSIASGLNDRGANGTASAAKRRRGANGGMLDSTVATIGKKTKSNGLHDDGRDEWVIILESMSNELIMAIDLAVVVMKGTGTGVEEVLRASIEDIVMRIIWSVIQFQSINTNSLIGGPNSNQSLGASQATLAGYKNLGKPSNSLNSGNKSVSTSQQTITVCHIEAGHSSFNANSLLDDLSCAQILGVHLFNHPVGVDSLMRMIETLSSLRGPSSSSSALAGMLHAVANHSEIDAATKQRLHQTIATLMQASTASLAWNGVSTSLGMTQMRSFAPTKAYMDALNESVRRTAESDSTSSPVLAASRAPTTNNFSTSHQPILTFEDKLNDEITQQHKINSHIFKDSTQNLPVVVTQPAVSVFGENKLTTNEETAKVVPKMVPQVVMNDATAVSEHAQNVIANSSDFNMDDLEINMEDSDEEN